MNSGSIPPMIHTVWRDFNGDFGHDLLREYLKSAPHP
jgi:hypothetical protein